MPTQTQEQLHKVRNLLTIQNAEIAVLKERDTHMKQVLEDLREEIVGLRKDVSEVHALANRWKGGFVVLAGLGGLFGWVMNQWEHIVRFIK